MFGLEDERLEEIERLKATRDKFAIDFYAYMQDNYMQVGDGFVEDLNMDTFKRITRTIESAMKIYNEAK